MSDHRHDEQAALEKRTDQMDPDQIAAQWQAVVDALTEAATTWREVSPESAEPVCELRDDAQWNVAYWRARGRGLDDLEAWRETRRVLGEPASRHIAYDDEQVSQ